MIGKVKCRSYKAKSSRQSRRRCPKCKKRECIEVVNYGKSGGILLFFACGHIR